MKRLKLFTLVSTTIFALFFVGCKNTVTEAEPQQITPTSYTVSISTNIANGTVTADKLIAQKNEVITLTLSADEGYELDSISIKDVSNKVIEITAVTAGTKYTFVMPESNVTVDATFKEIPPAKYTVTIATGIANGTVTADKLTVQKDETVTLTLAANEGYKFDSVSVKDVSNNTIQTAVVTTETIYTFVMPNRNVIVSATFKEIPLTKYAVTIATGISNGTVTADKQTAQKNEIVTLSMEARDGYELGSVSVKDTVNNTIETTAVTTGKKYTFVMPESNVNVSAIFKEIPKYRVSIIQPTGGYIGYSFPPGLTVHKGYLFRVYFHPDSGNMFDSISVKDSSNNDIETNLYEVSHLSKIIS